MSIAVVNVIVAAAVETRAIGKDGKMPWHISTDLKYFKARTENNIVIMGRKTYESIGKALPNRINIVLSTDPKYRDHVEMGVYVCTSYEEALRIGQTFKEKEIFVIGGGNLYKQAMKPGNLSLNRIYVTWVGYSADGLIEGDTHFPDIDQNEFEVIDTYDTEEKEFQLSFTTYERIKYGNN